jgi:carbamoyl-phosphate synthase small subunit
MIRGQLLTDTKKTARIILEDGTEFEGTAFGHESSVSGEIVFYTGEAGIPRLLSDPSLKGLILVLAQSGTGITGIPDESLCPLGLETAFESSDAQIAGLVVSTYCDDPSHYATRQSLAKWLKKQQIPAVYGIDTRALIQRLGLRGTMRAKILVSNTKDVSFSSPNLHSQSTQASTKRIVRYGNGAKKIIVVDCGIKNSVIRTLVTDDTTVIRVPCNYDYSKEDFDGIVIAGGPGDPTSCEKTIAVLKTVLPMKKPVFATGMGAVILALAAGGSAFKMAQGHRSASIPCIDLESGRCYITAQNHGYGIRDDSLPAVWYPTFLNNTDNSIEGFASEKGLLSAVLFQCEGNPGPHDTDFLYANFIEKVRKGGI